MAHESPWWLAGSYRLDPEFAFLCSDLNSIFALNDQSLV
ncbi:uncharacterized protein G2W53_037495 [Senna tora]|uniref:Uncharacterized protein n=1 Tax=Senna tora TaxID=362788 RepID=A0A834SXL1_9FABA|nr:uncharacterized protein G2W53_037495 [Senna tora]